MRVKTVSRIVVRNNMGLTMGSCTYPIKNVRDSTTTEAYACLHGIIFANELGFNDIVVEGDSLAVLENLRN